MLPFPTCSPWMCILRGTRVPKEHRPFWFLRFSLPSIATGSPSMVQWWEFSGPPMATNGHRWDPMESHYEFYWVPKELPHQTILVFVLDVSNRFSLKHNKTPG